MSKEKQPKNPADGYSKRQYETDLTRMAETIDKKEIEKIAQDLRRQLSNARTEAQKMNAAIDSKKRAQEVVPQIDEIEESIRARLKDRANLSIRAQKYGDDFLEIAEEAKSEIAAGRMIMSDDEIKDFFRELNNLSSAFNEQANSLRQNKFGQAIM